MITTLTRRRTGMAAVLALLIAISFMGGSISVRAQSAPPKPHLNFIQRHPTLTAIAAGAATHHALKAAAARDKAEGKKLNFAERHPTLSAIAVGAVVHHEIKKNTPVERH
jgi:hypothetical protein